MRQRVAEAFPPGDFIREEMEERGWSQLDLAQILDLQPAALNLVIAGRRKVTPELAQRLEDAFGPSAQYWMNLQTIFDLWNAGDRTHGVARRAKIFAKAPIRDMIKRGWIEPSDNIDVLEKRVCDFFCIDSIDDEPRLGYAAKTSVQIQTPTHRAWLFRAKQLAKSISATRFEKKNLGQCLARLRLLMQDPEETRHASKTLAEYGIRLVIVEQLPKTKIDGALFWLDATSPVIALSLRYDRIDWFWQALGHELGHLDKGHVEAFDVELDKNVQDDAKERTANAFAQALSIPEDELDGFIARVKPLYSHSRISGFANRLGIHPGIVVGQLQFRGELGYSHSRKFLVPIRRFVVPSTLTDGWGALLPASM